MCHRVFFFFSIKRCNWECKCSLTWSTLTWFERTFTKQIFTIAPMKWFRTLHISQWVLSNRSTRRDWETDNEPNQISRRMLSLFDNVRWHNCGPKTVALTYTIILYAKNEDIFTNTVILYKYNQLIERHIDTVYNDYWSYHKISVYHNLTYLFKNVFKG